MTLDEIREALRAAGLGRLADVAERLTLPAIRIEPQMVDEDTIPVGASKLGGRPDLPPDLAWPERDGKPLGFLVQFNLAEIAPYDAEKVLPPSGMLYFFYDFLNQPWGLDPTDRGGWQVVFQAAGDEALRRAQPMSNLPSNVKPEAHQLAFSSQATIEQDSVVLERLDLSEAEFKRYAKIRDDAAAFGHQLLGHPLIIHHDLMAIQCDVVASGQSGDFFYNLMIQPYENWDTDTRTRVERAHENWRLLLQLSSVPGLNAAFWDMDGLMYFWIENDHLAERDFSNVWVLGASAY
jgi:uncharacterized protein YwqG